MLTLDFIDPTRTVSNSIVEIYNVLGIDAARTAIYNEFIEVLADNDTYINEHHLTLLCDRMTYSKNMISVFRHGINNDDIGPIAKASFEETPEQFLKAARHAVLDNVKGVSASIMCGQEGYFGTNAFQVYLDMNILKNIDEQEEVETDTSSDKIDKLFGGLDNPDDPCSRTKLISNINTDNIQTLNLGTIDDDYELGI